ncbi:MAG TPA: zf-HC2 domain-containing protein [Oscillospiraceae bacterium]|nr:zf-HC2 domain-containing protein [Oscillospiraceae bacterium]
MTCEEVIESMAEYLDELLPAERKNAYERHLQTCALCRKLTTETKSAVQWVQQAEKLTPPPNLRSAVLSTLKQEKQANRTHLAPGLVQIMAAAAVFVLLIAGNLLPWAADGTPEIRGYDGSAVMFDNSSPPAEQFSGAESEEQVIKKADESAVVAAQRQTKRPAQPRFSPRLVVNLVLSTVIIILLMMARKKRRGLLP